MNHQSHVLDITKYSFDEILDLFKLTYNITIEDLKRAKKKVLMTHPDKSKLPSEYFLFYKKAFDIVVNYYDVTHKSQKSDTPSPNELAYNPTSLGYDKNIHSQITQRMNQMKSSDMQAEFNRIFEQNAKREVVDRNSWFKEETPVYDVQENVGKNNLNAAIEKVRTNQHAMVQYKGVQNMIASSGTTNYFDDDDDNADAEYLSCDVFSKLKFDDLRKVHKDQTIFNISESAYQNMPKYNSVDQYSRARNDNMGTPLTREESMRIFEQQERARKAHMATQQHKANLRVAESQVKNQNILSQFLKLEF